MFRKGGPSIRERVQRVADFAADLKRRKVYRVAAAYGAIAFVLGQTASFVFPALRLPDFALTLLVVLLILGFPLALGLSWAFDVTPEGIRRTGPAERARESVAASGTPHGAPAPDASPSVAVLPFVAMGTGPEGEAFADGLTEELLNALAGLDDLRVVSRTSSFQFKGQDRDVREIAGSLGAHAVLEGSVRGGAGRVRVTAQLIRGADGFHLFSETYDRPLGDPLAVQEEISRAVAHAVGRRLRTRFGAEEGGERSAARLPDEAARGGELLKLRTPEALRDAVGLFREVVASEPELAAGHAGLAEALALLGDMRVLPPDEAFPEARAAACRAVKLDEGLARGHAVLGFIRVLCWDWNDAERHLRRALELDPELAPAHRWRSLYLSARGRLPEAIRNAEEALRLEGETASAHAALAALHYYHRKPGRALECGRKALALVPEAVFPQALMGMAEELRGDPAAAKARLKSAIAASRGNDPLLVGALARAHAGAGEERSARALLTRLEALARSTYVSGFLLAGVYSAVGRVDDAFRALEEAVSARDGWLLALRVHPWMDGLRDEPRFGPLLAEVGLAEREEGEAG